MMIDQVDAKIEELNTKLEVAQSDVDVIVTELKRLSQARKLLLGEAAGAKKRTRVESCTREELRTYATTALSLIGQKGELAVPDLATELKVPTQVARAAILKLARDKRVISVARGKWAVAQ